MPFLVTAEDIASSIIKTNAAAQGVDAIFSSCTALDAGTKSAWTAWYTGWQAWAKENDDLGYLTLGLPAIGNQAVSYEGDVAGWQTTANRICGSSVPVLVPQPDAANENAGLPGNYDGLITAAKWIAAAVVVVTVAPPVFRAIAEVAADRKAMRGASGDGARTAKKNPVQTPAWRAEIAAQANAILEGARRGPYPRLTASSSRSTLITWLQKVDPNGIHTDALARLDDVDPYTLETAWDAVDMIKDS